MEKIHGVFASGCLIVIMMILDSAHKDQVLTASADFTVFLQGMSTSVTDYFFRIVSCLSLWLVVLIPLFCLARDGLKVGLPILSVVALSVAMLNLVKMAVGEERPYWAFESVKAISCALGYGFPSGHSLLVGSAFGMYAYFSFKKGKKALAWTLLGGIFLVALSRLYLGVHSLNQVLIALAIAGGNIAGLPMMKLHKDTSLLKHIIGAHVFVVVAILLAWVIYASEPIWDYEWSTYIAEVMGT